ncbi:MAG: mandelate racemase [Candidatus Eremiobacteraeota bacterium]|nr:mandelate racemase [Candidatus Eremiobacteraeota bacterium]
MRIRSVRARAIDLPLQRPVELSSGTMRSAPLVLVDVQTEEGPVGVSYVRCYTPVAMHPLAALVENLEELLRGDASDPAAVAAKLDRHFLLVGPQGLTGIAMAAIDMALWDAQAKALDMPLVRLLGGQMVPVPAYASLRTMGARGAAAEAESRVNEGFTALKLKVGPNLDRTLESIRAVRGAVGDGVSLMVDYNQSLTVCEALEHVRALDGEGLAWIEEPTRADDFAGHARIAAAAATPIQLGENWWGVHDLEKSIAAGASDNLMFDAMKIGGVTGWLAAAKIAQAAGLSVSSHTFPEFSVHLLGVTRSAMWLEYLDHTSPILLEPVRVERGLAYAPARAGSGLAWDEPAINGYLSRDP